MRFFFGGASARAARAAGSIFVKASDGWAPRTACDDMSGAGAGVVVRGRTASGRQGSGRPTRSLVTIAGEPLSSVASATNSNAARTRPTTARKARAGIVALRLRPPQHSGEYFRPRCRLVELD